MASFQRLCLLFGVSTLIFLFVPATQAAPALDTSAPIICAFTKAFDCDSAQGCETTSPDDIGLPVFFKLDLANNKVTAAGARQAGDKNETTIGTAREADGKLFFQGVERRGWSLIIEKETGKMALSASSDDEAIVLFGRCTAP